LSARTSPQQFGSPIWGARSEEWRTPRAWVAWQSPGEVAAHTAVEQNIRAVICIVAVTKRCFETSGVYCPDLAPAVDGFLAARAADEPYMASPLICCQLAALIVSN
jgi:hypothetical protein